MEALCNLQGCDQCNGNDGLAGGELRSTGDNAVVDALAASLLLHNLDNRWATTLLLVDLLHSRFLRTVHAEELHHGGDRTNWSKNVYNRMDKEEIGKWIQAGEEKLENRGADDSLDCVGTEQNISFPSLCACQT